MARNDGIDRTSVRNLAVSDKAVGNTQQHNEREKDSYRNPDIIPQRAAWNVHFKKPTASYTDLSSTPVQSMEIFLPSRSSSSTQPVSILNLQALSSYFIIIPSKSCYWLTVYDKVSEFCAVHGSLHCCTRRKRKIRTLLQSETGSDFSCLVGAGGFEPPKLKAADLQSVPIGHSGTRPYSLFVSFAGRLVYSIMQKGFCQLFFYLFLQMRFPCRETAEQRREKPCSHAGTAKSEKKASRKKLIGKLQEKLGTICEKCKTFCLCIEKRSKA